ncbi:hypothetical protein MPSEU_000213900 [Mayamaea pseudoterrestris]|nr:hypothetical protein MPSEU_000213900 [Mayamaea pseudoterrestris]
MSSPPKSILKQDDSQKSLSKHVQFSDLTIFEFHSILGDNPAVSDGSPLTLDWMHESQTTLPIHIHEFAKKSRPRRKRKEMRLSSAARDMYLLSEGYTLEQLLKAAEATKHAQEQRRASMKGTSWDRFRKAVDGFKVDGFKLQKKVAGTAA